MIDRATIQRAISRAVAFLTERQLPTGELPVLAAGKPDPSVFPTALAAHTLSFAPEAATLRARALDFLEREMQPRGLWKHWTREHPFAHELPPDLDDTSCASAALARAGRTFVDNKALLLRNRNRAGLFYTWKLTRTQLRHPLVCAMFFLKTSAKPFDVDAVVNANVLFYFGATPELRPVVTYLLDVLRERRETVCDKWYEKPFVVWYFFSRALRGVAPEAGELIPRAIAESTPANALEYAMAVSSMRDWNREFDLTPLLDMQLPSGGWPEARFYHGGRKRLGAFAFAPPHPDTPWWGSEELTTAFCIEALARGSER
ncbi:MAG TPA: hypothetical protein VHW00_17225 [Thermoanaerobaculia bacterium]|nr:hypothetical protein [Thermoanaerobaculia bacterium]